jgi:hypothetical protein
MEKSQKLPIKRKQIDIFCRNNFPIPNPEPFERISAKVAFVNVNSFFILMSIYPVSARETVSRVTR